MTHRLPFLDTTRTQIVRMPDEPSPAAELAPPSPRSCIVNFDKPQGITSRKAADLVAAALGVSKTGHSGTLDPAVTGVLPVASGKATRVLGLLLSAGKEYRGVASIHGRVEREQLDSAVASFVGTIVQTPPVRSRVKRVARPRKVYYFEILNIEGRRVEFLTGVEAGTYIRKLIHDLGETLGTGAHMLSLRRTRAGPFSEESLVPIDVLAQAGKAHRKGDPEALRPYILPPAAAVSHLGRVWLVDGALGPVCSGSPLYLPGVSHLTSGIARNDMVAVLTAGNELVALGRALLSSEEMSKGERGTAVKVRRVIFDGGA
jgi:H/ACA ribonucleoprotein complex subunit 4